MVDTFIKNVSHNEYAKPFSTDPSRVSLTVEHLFPPAAYKT